MAKKARKTKSSLRPSTVISGQQRLNRVLAGAGLGSRRDVEQLIVDGRVDVDGNTVTDLAFKVDPTVSEIEVDGTTIKNHRPVYFALNKPAGVLSTNHDPSGRTRVIDLIPSRERIFPVGRLDRSSEGLMLLTNDGELAQRLAHPKYGVQKTYFVVVQGMIGNEDLAKLKKGVYLADGVARIDGAKVRKQRKTCTELEIILSEGKNREIRRILARVGHKVMVLRRLAIGPLRLAQLPVGQSRPLTGAEVEALYHATAVARQQSKKADAGKPDSDKPRAGKSGPSKSGVGKSRSGKSGDRPQRSRSSAPPQYRLESLDVELNAQPKLGSIIAYDAEAPAEQRGRKSAGANRKRPTSRTSSRPASGGGRGGVARGGSRPTAAGKRATGKPRTGQSRPGPAKAAKPSNRRGNPKRSGR